MENVQKMSTQGLKLIKKSLITLCCVVKAPPKDTALLEDVTVTFTFSHTNLIAWFNKAVEKTTHQRYINWFRKSFRGGKCKVDDNYKPDSDSSGTTLSRSTRPRTQSQQWIFGPKVSNLGARSPASSRLAHAVITSSPPLDVLFTNIWLSTCFFFVFEYTRTAFIQLFPIYITFCAFSCILHLYRPRVLYQHPKLCFHPFDQIHLNPAL